MIRNDPIKGIISFSMFVALEIDNQDDENINFFICLL